MVAVLHEVKYLEASNTEDIPSSAVGVYSQNEMFRKYVNNLELTTTWYNKIHQTVLVIEFPLIEGQLGEIDTILQEAENNLKWSSPGEHPYLSNCLSILI